jgi:hypothetical protein
MRVDENSSIKIVMVMAAVPFVVGAIFWLANLSDRAMANEVEVQGLKAIVSELRDHTLSMEQDVKWIKERLKKK